MIPSKVLAFALAVVASPFVLAATPKQVPFVPSSVQQPDAHAGRFGLITTISYGRYGQKTTSTQIIDLDAYISSGGKKMVVGAKAAKLAAMNAACHVPGLDGTCMDGGDENGNTDIGGSTGGSGGGGTYRGGGPGSAAPKPPHAPDSPDVPGDTVLVTYTQIYDHGKWQQTSTYSREAMPDGNGGGNDTRWGPVVIHQDPVKP
ncbi:MAG TPA: hypothetical protein VFN13_12735 [Rudaea sp.]|nr:hypothetical protein [Rudaea sp.]